MSINNLIEGETTNTKQLQNEGLKYISSSFGIGKPTLHAYGNADYMAVIQQKGNAYVVIKASYMTEQANNTITEGLL